MLSKLTLFLVVLIGGSRFAIGNAVSPIPAEGSPDWVASDQLAEQIANSLLDDFQRITDTLETVSPDVLRSYIRIYAPSLLNRVNDMLPTTSYLNLKTLITVMPEVLRLTNGLTTAGPLLQQFMPKIGGVVDNFMTRFQGLFNGATVAPSSSTALARHRRSIVGMFSPIFDKMMSMVTSILQNILGVSTGAVRSAMVNTFYVTCNVGGILYDNLIDSKSGPANCYAMTTELNNNPTRFMTDLTAYGMSRFSSVAADVGMYMLNKMWTISKNTVIPALHEELDTLKDQGKLPANIASLVSTLDVAYSMMQMMGVL